MVVRRTTTFTSEPYDDFVAYLDSQQEIIDGIVSDVVDDFGAEVKSELGTEPPKPEYPLRWASDKQRRAFFATDGFGSGIPYKRTGKLADAWVVKSNGSAIVIENPSKVAKFVYGSFAQNRTQALRFQQPFHADTGWQAYDTLVFWLDALDEEVRQRFSQDFAEFGQVQTRTRAFTR